MKDVLRWYSLKDRNVIVVAEYQESNEMQARKFFFKNGLLPEFWSTDFIIEEEKLNKEGKWNY